MIEEIKWYIKPSKTGTYVKMLQPAEFTIELEDLDKDSYRSVINGNLIDNRISRNWTKVNFKFKGLTKDEVYNLISKISVNPIYAKIENPIYSGGYIEAQFRCSKKSINKEIAFRELYEVSANLVQKNKIGGM